MGTHSAQPQVEVLSDFRRRSGVCRSAPTGAIDLLKGDSAEEIVAGRDTNGVQMLECVSKKDLQARLPQPAVECCLKPYWAPLAGEPD